MRKLILSILFCIIAALNITAQSSEFAYQGRLQVTGTPANGNFDLEFKLFDLVAGGAQQGSTVQRLNVAVANGIFSVFLDFGAANLPGSDRFLDIAVRTAGGGAFTSLSPRQKISSVPYSLKSLSSTTAATATNATQLGGVAASQYVVTTDPRMTDARTPTAGSTNYIQNQDAAPQSSSNFYISGTGTANFVNAMTQFNLNNVRILSAPANNLFVGSQTGQSNTTGDSNSFFGRSAGANNTIGGNNSFFGFLAGNTTNTGNGNAFFGYSAGRSNTTGGVNSYFGFNAGEFSTTANYNSFFGYNAGNKTTADDNSFFGASAGQANTSGTFNSFFGRNAGFSNTTGGSHVFIGVNAGYFNTTGGSNAFVGKDAGFANTTGGENAFFGAAAGQTNTTASNNTFVGATAGLLNNTGGDNSFMGHAAGYSNTTGVSNSFFGSAAGNANVAGNSNSFFGRNAGISTTSNDNSFFGVFAGGFNTTGTRNTAIGYNANVGAGTLQFATAIGADSTVSSSNTIALGRSNGSDQVVIPGTLVANLPSGDADYIQNRTSQQASSNFSISGNGAVGGNMGVGTTSPVTRLDVRGPMVLDGGAMFTAASGGEQNRYLSLINSPTTQTASGLKAGGALVADDYFYANPGKNDLIVKGNVGIGTTTPLSKLGVTTSTNSRGFSHSDGSVILTSYVGPGTVGTNGGYLGTATNHPLYFFTNNNVTPRMTIFTDGSIAIGQNTPNGLLAVAGTISYVSAGAGSLEVCKSLAGQLASCSSSLRYKTNIGEFSQGMSFINKLRPISFDWKDGGMKDIGFGAEEVAKIDQRFVTYNDNGEVEGVKYNRLSVAFVNAFKEQQTEIEAHQKQNEQQQKRLIQMQAEIDALKALVCLDKPSAGICR